MNEDLFIIRLRDCFTAGYTFPQFCIDNNIKKPLFVALDERRADFLWEIFVQFKFDKRITPRFTLLNNKVGSLNFSVVDNLPELNFERVNDVNLNDFDAVIVLNAIRLNTKFPRIIYLDQLTDYFIRRTYEEIPLLHFMQRHPRVKLIVTNFPRQPKIDDENFKRQLLSIKDTKDKITSNEGVEVPTLFDKLGYNNAEAFDLMSVPLLTSNLDGSTKMEDDENPLIGIKNNQRMTADQPENFVNTIYFVGTCHHYGINAPFDKTIASYLQRMLNEKNLPYRVENPSQRYFSRQQDLFYNLVKLAPKPDDIIFVYVANLHPINLPFFDVSNAFDGCDYRKLWTNDGHSNELGYKILAEHFFQFLTQNNFFKDVKFNYPPPPLPPHRYGIPKENSSPATKLFDAAELEAHKKKLRARRLKIGCIVMNANPFTRGHEYLVEYAASRVHKLFVMVVSEDKSEFSFADRFELVKRGTKQFPNVEVIPSGNFVISQKTFEGYFNKENLQNVQVDSTADVKIFAEEIAPSLGVNVRFVGEEPEDTVTRRYNETMKSFLPHYDINFCEIPRREIDGEIISAKTVRAALKAGDLNKIKKLVPAATYEFLREKYFK